MKPTLTALAALCMLSLALDPSTAWACWQADLHAHTDFIEDTKTTLSLAWTPMPDEDQCSASIGDFAYYRLEVGKKSAPSSPGDGATVAELWDVGAFVWSIPVDKAGTTVPVSIFVCDSSDRCVLGTDGQLTATTDKK